MLKSKSITALFLAFALLFSLAPVSLGEDNGLDPILEHFYLEDEDGNLLEDLDKDEVAEVIQRIANAENVVFGDGVEFHGAEEEEEGAISPLWLGKETNLTHQWLTARILAFPAFSC